MFVFNLPEHIENLILSYIPLWWMPHGTIANIKTNLNLINGVILYNNIWNCKWFNHKTGCFTLNSAVMSKDQKQFSIYRLLKIKNILVYK